WRPRAHRVLGGEHHRTGAVGRRAGLEITNRVPEHRGVLDLLQADVLDVEVRIGVAQCVETVLDGDEHTDVRRRTGAADVGADDRREVAPGAGDDGKLEGDLHREGPHRVAVRLLLESDGEHAPVNTRLDEVSGDDRR